MPQTLQEIMQTQNVTPSEALVIRGQQEQDELQARLKPLREAAEADRAAKQKAAEADRAAKQKAHDDRIEAGLKAEALKAYVDNGGKPADFDRVWPTLRDEALRLRTLAALSNPTRVNAAQTREAF